MILCQQIIVEYDKSSRGAEGAAARGTLPEAYALPETFWGQKGNCHCVWLRQNGTDFFRRDSMLELSSIKEMEIVENNDVYEITFTYHSAIGKPVRTFRHAKKPIITGSTDYLHSTLKEIAFTLSRTQSYGRMRFNGRLTDFDTGQWYYESTVVNIIHTEGGFDRDIFVSRQPDVVYSQLEKL